MKKLAKLSLNYHQISSNTHLILSRTLCFITQPGIHAGEAQNDSSSLYNQRYTSIVGNESR